MPPITLMADRELRAQHELTREQVAIIRKRRAEGAFWIAIAREIDVSVERIRRQCDPGFRARRNRQNAENRKLYAETLRFDHTLTPGRGGISAAEAARIIRAVPPDTRSFTARAFGDPLPGRSALDARQRAQ